MAALEDGEGAPESASESSAFEARDSERFVVDGFGGAEGGGLRASQQDGGATDDEKQQRKQWQFQWPVLHQLNCQQRTIQQLKNTTSTTDDEEKGNGKILKTQNRESTCWATENPLWDGQLFLPNPIQVYLSSIGRNQ